MAVALMSTAAIAASTGSASATTYAKFENANSHLCLAIPAESTANGTEAIQWSCDSNGTDQLWALDYIGTSNQFHIRNAFSQDCLGIGGSSKEKGQYAIQWPCDGAVDQVWQADSTGRLWNVHSQLCLSVPSASTTPGVKVIQWTCESVTSNPEQKWA